MNKFYFLETIFYFSRLSIYIILLFWGRKNCLNYPYPNGIYFKNKFSDKKQLIYTQSVSIKTENIRKIEFIKKKNNLYAITSLSKHIKLNSRD